MPHPLACTIIMVIYRHGTCMGVTCDSYGCTYNVGYGPICRETCAMVAA